MTPVPIKRLPLAAEAAATLTVASVRVLLKPDAQTAALLGDARPQDPDEPSAPPPADDVMRIGRAVDRVAAVLPWHPVCLPRAVAVASMLRRRGIECRAHLGVTSTEPPEAHAWVTVDGIVVQGGPVNNVTELASFV